MLLNLTSDIVIVIRYGRKIEAAEAVFCFLPTYKPKNSAKNPIHTGVRTGLGLHHFTIVRSLSV